MKIKTSEKVNQAANKCEKNCSCLSNKGDPLRKVRGRADADNKVNFINECNNNECCSCTMSSEESNHKGDL